MQGQQQSQTQTQTQIQTQQESKTENKTYDKKINTLVSEFKKWHKINNYTRLYAGTVLMELQEIIKAKNKTGAGEKIQWCNFVYDVLGISASTANNYMKFAAYHNKVAYELAKQGGDIARATFKECLSIIDSLDVSYEDLYVQHCENINFKRYPRRKALALNENPNTNAHYDTYNNDVLNTLSKKMNPKNCNHDPGLLNASNDSPNLSDIDNNNNSDAPDLLDFVDNENSNDENYNNNNGNNDIDMNIDNKECNNDNNGDHSVDIESVNELCRDLSSIENEYNPFYKNPFASFNKPQCCEDKMFIIKMLVDHINLLKKN